MFQILIVDDDKNLKRALSLLLTDSGYRTFSAGSAREALHTLEKCRMYKFPKKDNTKIKS